MGNHPLPEGKGHQWEITLSLKGEGIDGKLPSP